MEKFTVLRAIAAPLLRENIDTDIVIRIERLVGASSRSALGRYAFESWRYRPDGSEEPSFVLNREPYRRAQILLAGRNFGCGSSREGAVWALKQMGFRAVLAPSFGDIFFNNCFQNGALPIRLPVERVARLRVILHELPGATLAIDLAAQTVVGPDGQTDKFDIDSFRKDMLLKGTDSIDFTLGYAQDIARFEDGQRRDMPWL